jgi:hypothetical protein
MVKHASNNTPVKGRFLPHARMSSTVARRRHCLVPEGSSQPRLSNDESTHQMSTACRFSCSTQDSRARRELPDSILADERHGPEEPYQQWPQLEVPPLLAYSPRITTPDTFVTAWWCYQAWSSIARSAQSDSQSSIPSRKERPF